MVLVAAAVLWWQPLRVYRCGAQGAGLAQCVVADRWLGLVPVRERGITGIAQALYGAHVERTKQSQGGTESAPTGGAPREILTTVEQMSLLDDRQRVLWSASESHLVGASLSALAVDIEALCSGEESSPWVRWYAPWPPWLLGCLFALIGASHLSARVGLGLISRGLLPRSLYQAVYWGPTLVALALLAGVWLIALAGGSPPAWLSVIFAPTAR